MGYSDESESASEDSYREREDNEDETLEDLCEKLSCKPPKPLDEDVASFLEAGSLRTHRLSFSHEARIGGSTE